MAVARALTDELFDAKAPRVEIDPGLFAKYGERAYQLMESAARYAVDGVTEFYKKNTGKIPDLSGITVRLAKLPTYVSRSTGRVVGKIFGQYNMKGSITVDPVTLSELGDPERQYIDRIPDAESVATHETFHAAHHRTGGIGKYIRRFGDHARGKIEGITNYATSLITGRKQSTYARETEEAAKLVQRHGLERAIAGDVPGNYNNVQLVPVYALRIQRPALARYAF